MPHTLVAGNWKMNGLRTDGIALARELVRKAQSAKRYPQNRIAICPPATLLAPLAGFLMGSPIGLGGQDCHMAEKGAYTGDISAKMLKDTGCQYVILGHSERRSAHHETDAMVRAKAKAAIEAGLHVILCVGEDLVSREKGNPEQQVADQLRQSVPDNADPAHLSIAYEPIWAIGTGRTAGPHEIARMLQALASSLPSRPAAGLPFSFLYGGSVKADNAAELSRIPEVGGFLVGGASLEADSFWAIVEAAEVSKF